MKFAMLLAGASLMLSAADPNALTPAEKAATGVLGT